MEIRGVSYGDVERIITQVSRDRYAGNIESVNGHALLSGGRGFRGRLRARNSRGQGARNSASGRRGPYACWHAYRDVLAAIFAEYPDTRVRTAMARYDGRAGFDANYPATAYANVGSPMQPAYMGDLCDHGNASFLYAPTDSLAPTVDRAASVPATYDLVAEIDAVLSAVAADGWTDPYTDPKSPALRLQ